ncbi:M15 family metallopeptidase [Exilibacterium tricleocarpae]|uniref:M15 family metallopeptidase n=2 Tax=Exilibacterium tricleocarpae TaxID=2591008 RepID=A0A545STP2_9GAMM|nr:M15 family metallopeptidase [Exilibacterium tricleocarpae]
MIVTQELTGQIDAHVICLPASDQRVHRELLGPLAALTESARQAGFDLQVASGFRSFERQLHIWNAKARGLRPVLDSAGAPLDIASLDNTRRMFAILRWSALPGASRHHWGCDVDIYDAAAVAHDYKLQLSVAETCAGGPFAELHAWLDGFLLRREDLGFFRPYGADRGGVAPEPWHLSFAPLARQFQAALQPDCVAAAIEAADLALKAEVLANIEEIFQRFIHVPQSAYPGESGNFEPDREG